jgi:hypothetical protein
MSFSPIHRTMSWQVAAAQVPTDDSLVIEAAVDEIIDRATSSPRERLLLVQEGFIPKLVAVLQEPLQVATGQPHTAAAWALFHLLWRSQAAPQGCPAAHSAMAAAGAVKHLTTVLKAVRKSQGSGGGACSSGSARRAGGSQACEAEWHIMARTTAYASCLLWPELLRM